MKHVAMGVVALLGACSGDQPVPTTPAVSVASDPTSSTLPLVQVYKNETCGCCEAWVKHLEGQGFAVEVHNLDNLLGVKQRARVPAAMGSCHTAEVGGYFIEGHVPADDIKRLLRERPSVRGLTVPGMPIGSPGMELPSTPAQAYDVLQYSDDGRVSVFQHHPAK